MIGNQIRVFVLGQKLHRHTTIAKSPAMTFKQTRETGKRYTSWNLEKRIMLMGTIPEAAYSEASTTNELDHLFSLARNTVLVGWNLRPSPSGSSMISSERGLSTTNSSLTLVCPGRRKTLLESSTCFAMWPNPAKLQRSTPPQDLESPKCSSQTFSYVNAACSQSGWYQHQTLFIQTKLWCIGWCIVMCGLHINCARRNFRVASENKIQRKEVHIFW